MRAALLVLGLVLAACGSSTTPAPANQATHTPPTTPPPSIAFTSQFVVTGLPAVARSGELVVAAMRDPDGGRGFDNLSVEIRDRGDRRLDVIGVLAASDYERLVPDGVASPELQRAVGAANERLAALHADHDLVEMDRFEMEGDIHGDTRRALGHGLVVEWNAPRLVVRDAGKQLASVDGTSWLPAPAQRCAQCPPCSHPAYIEAAFKARGLNVLGIRLAYVGNDTCWEPPPQLHVIAW